VVLIGLSRVLGVRGELYQEVLLYRSKINFERIKLQFADGIFGERMRSGKVHD